MSYTAFTALIITIHDLGAITALILALALSGLGYLIFMRHYHHRLLLFLGLFFVSFIACAYFSYEIFAHKVIGLEIVQTK